MLLINICPLRQAEAITQNRHTVTQATNWAIPNSGTPENILVYREPRSYTPSRASHMTFQTPNSEYRFWIAKEDREEYTAKCIIEAREAMHCQGHTR